MGVTQDARDNAIDVTYPTKPERDNQSHALPAA